ncbi:MAG: ribonuclease H-like domain-containing protein [Phycisphaerae bacterium]|jgi:hypothetical protein
MKLLSFDIEIADVFELKPNEDIGKYAPFHISVASTVAHGGEARIWYSADENNNPYLHMSKDKANELLCFLKAKQDEGYAICAWNGLGFDLQWIGYNAQNMKFASEIALHLYDPMFQFFNQRGFPVALASVAKAMGIKQSKLLNSEDAPKEWHAGNYQKVMDYVLGDSQITNLIINEIIKRKEIVWITKQNQIRTEPIARLKTVEEILKEPEPDQSWMKTELKRKNFYKWFPKN